MSRRNIMALREPNGRSQRGPSETPPTQARRLRDAALTGLRDPEWGAELGRLFLAEKITAAMYAAGKDWREKATRYRGVIGIKSLRSPALDQQTGGTPPDPDSDEGKDQAARERDMMEKFYELHSILVQAGMLAERVVRRVCEDDLSPCGHSELMALKRGLSTLADHRGLTNGGKSRHVR